MKNVEYKIDYIDLNKLLREIIGDELELDEKNANEKIRNLYFDKSKQMKKLDKIIKETEKNNNENYKALQFKNDVEIFKNASSILLNLFINESNILSIECNDLISELVLNDDIQQVLKDELPSLRKISEYIHSKENVTVDTTDMIGMIFETINNMDFEQLNEVEYFKKLDKAFKEFYEDGEVDEMFD